MVYGEFEFFIVSLYISKSLIYLTYSGQFCSASILAFKYPEQLFLKSSGFG